LLEDIVPLIRSVLKNSSFTGARPVADAIAGCVMEAGYEVRVSYEVLLSECSLEVLKPVGSMGEEGLVHRSGTPEDRELKVHVVGGEGRNRRWTCTVAVTSSDRVWATVRVFEGGFI